MVGALGACNALGDGMLPKMKNIAKLAVVLTDLADEADRLPIEFQGFAQDAVRAISMLAGLLSIERMQERIKYGPIEGQDEERLTRPTGIRR